MSQVFIDILNTAQNSLFYVTDPSKRIYWGFLLTSAIMGWVFSLFVRYRYHAGSSQPFGNTLSQSVYDLINPSALFTRSTLVDISLLVTNHVLRLMLFLPLLGSQIAVALAVSRFLNAHVMDSPQLLFSATSIAVLFSLVFFIIDDLSRFLLHVLMHKLPWLWQFHELHHNPTTMTPLTLYRFHPVEVFLLTCRSLIVGGVVSGIFVYLFAGRITGWDMIGVNAFGFIFSALGSNLRHSHIPLSFGMFERLFISPAQHQLHHSKDHIDINFGTYLAIWDKLFGSWVQGSAKQNIKFGLAD